MNIIKKYTGILLNILVPLAVTFLVCLLGPKLLKFFMPFVVGMVIALIAAPVVRFLEKRIKLVRHVSSMIIIVGALGLIVLAIWLLTSWLIQQGIQFVKDVPVLYESIKTELQQTLMKMEHLLAVMPAGVKESIFDGFDNIGMLVTEKASELYSPTMEIAGSVARSIPNIMVSIIVAILSAYFFLADFDKLKESTKTIMPGFVMKAAAIARKKSSQIVGSYFLAQFRIMFVIGIVLAIGLTIIDVSYSGLVAFLIAILDFLPIFGTGTILIPWAVIKLLNGAYGTAVFLLALYGVTQLIRQLIQPKLIGDSMGMNPLLTLLFLYVGYKWKGFTGMILAVPVGMILLEIIKMGAYDSLVDGVITLCHETASLMAQARNKKRDRDEEI